MIVCIQDGSQTLRTVTRESCAICLELDMLEDGEIYTLNVDPKIVDNVITYIEMKHANTFEHCGPAFFDRLKHEGMLASVRGVMQTIRCVVFETDVQRFTSTDTSMDKLRSAFKSKLKLH